MSDVFGTTYDMVLCNPHDSAYRVPQESGAQLAPPQVSITLEVEAQYMSMNRKHLREKMKGTWQLDSYFFEKHFPLKAEGRTYSKNLIASHYSQKTKKWKRLGNKDISSPQLLSVLHSLLNTVLSRFQIPTYQRKFLKPDPKTMKVSRSPLPSPDLLLAGSGDIMHANAQGPPVAEYSSGIAPVQVMLESEYKHTKRHLLAVYANEIFQKQDNRRYIYAMILTEQFLRGFMFDTAGCVMSTPLDYHDKPAEFCSVIAGMATLDEVKAGFDTSLLLDENGAFHIWTTERGDGGPPRPISYRVQTRLFKASRLLGRATSCWLVTSTDSGLIETFVIKDAWVAPSDTHSEMEGNLIDYANKKGVVRGLVRIHHQEIKTVPGRTTDTVIKNRRIRTDAVTETTCIVQDRIHTRIVMQTYGKLISKFSSRLELLYAMRDAVKAHRNLYKIAKILHRDISIGNILINKDPKAEEGDRGILIDLDFAVRLENLPKGSLNIGTQRFISHRILQRKGRHTFLDDLESFYYVFCWLVCLHNGPGDISTSYIKKTPKALVALDVKDKGEAKLEHLRKPFDLPVQPWFGDVFGDMMTQLHGLLRRRIVQSGFELCSGRDYKEYIGYIQEAIEKLGPYETAVTFQALPESAPGQNTTVAHVSKRKLVELPDQVLEPEQPKRKCAKLSVVLPLRRSARVARQITATSRQKRRKR